MRSVHLIIGTKAQFIKMAPIAYLMEQENIPYRIIDLSQHGALTGQIMADFGLRPDIRFLQPTGANVATYSAAIRWTTQCISQMMRRKSDLRSSFLLEGRHPVALVHGDTLSTLLGTYLARRLGLEVGLVEAGLSSGRIFSPFPEEAIRRHVEGRVEFLFATGDSGEQRLRQRKVRGVIFNTHYNTGRDAFSLIAAKAANSVLTKEQPYTVLTLHRSETISRKTRLRAVVDHVLAVADRLPPMRFYVHEPTLRALKKAKLMDGLAAHPKIKIASLAGYPDFVRALMLADFVLTDGGSIQEEASYMGKPCLVLRSETEREHGLGTTARLTTLDADKDVEFLRSVPHQDCTAGRMMQFEASRSILVAIGALQ